jgi:hypothetical protein
MIRNSHLRYHVKVPQELSFSEKHRRIVESTWASGLFVGLIAINLVAVIVQLGLGYRPEFGLTSVRSLPVIAFLVGIGCGFGLTLWKPDWRAMLTASLPPAAWVAFMYTRSPTETMGDFPFGSRFAEPGLVLLIAMQSGWLFLASRYNRARRA